MWTNGFCQPLESLQEMKFLATEAEMALGLVLNIDAAAELIGVFLSNIPAYRLRTQA